MAMWPQTVPRMQTGVGRHDPSPGDILTRHLQIVSLTLCTEPLCSFPGPSCSAAELP